MEDIVMYFPHWVTFKNATRPNGPLEPNATKKMTKGDLLANKGDILSRF